MVHIYCRMELPMNEKAHETKTYGIILLLVLLPLFCLGIGNHGLWTADEPRVAEIGREMALTGNWVVPSLNQKPFLEEPPFYYASVAAVFRVLGRVSDRAARVPSLIFALGGCVALFFLGTFLFSPRVGLLSSLILGTGFEYFRVAHWLVVDSALACFIITAMTFFVMGYASENKRKKFLFYVLFYISCVGAFFTKGFIGLAVPGLAIVAFLAFEHNLKELLRMHLWLGILIFLVLTLPWFFGLKDQGGAEYLRIFLIKNHLQRFLPGGSSGHHQPFYYYLIGFPEGFLPWSLLLIPVLFYSFRKAPNLPAVQKSGITYLKCWFIMGIIFLSAASTKRILYLVPVFAPFAVLTARYVDSTLLPRLFTRVEKVFLYIFATVPLLLGAAMTPVYLVASGKYSLIASHSLLTMVVAASALAFGLSSISFTHLYRKRMNRFWIFSGGAFYAVLIFSLVAVMPVLDRFKSFVPFTDQVKAIVTADQEFYAYAPDETLRAIIPFYTGLYMKETENKDFLAARAGKANRIFVAIRDKRGQLEDELVSTGLFSVIVRQGAKEDRAIVLLSNRER
jgi:4-amino-4-deoxy-L-arabinose transferase-like glycosyltransferase